MASDDELPYLPIQNLAERHPALTPFLAGSFLEAASVCLDQHYQPPTVFVLEDDNVEVIANTLWDIPDERTKAAWANQDDATRDGAYALAIATVELTRNLYAVRRAETRTGADYYIAPADQPLDDLENFFRLEVSGTHLDKSEVKRRLRIKARQAQQGNSNLPALAAVVGFGVKLVVIQTVDSAL